MQYGARNQLSAKVSYIKRGTIMGQVGLEIAEKSTMGSVMTLDSLNELDLKEGDSVKVIVKAINVLVIKED